MEKTKLSSDKKKSNSVKFHLPKEQLLHMHDLMVKSRVLEERLIRIYKMGEAFFWIGGPGEEAFGVPLGLLINKGQGIQHDWMHLHYRATPTMIALGMEMIDSIRLIMNRASDPSTGGRNFSNHYCFPKWNVAPITSPIEVQYSHAMGTAWVQKRSQAKGITIVSGGDAGTAEGDFASCLIWSSRPGKELPIFITVQNNRWGISTDYDSQHGEKFISDRAKAFGIRTANIYGNDPEESYIRMKEEMDYIRKERKPVVAEIFVSRLYGHSSASGANFISHEEDPLKVFEAKLLNGGLLKEADAKELYTKYDEESKRDWEIVRKEAVPQADTIWDHIFVNNENADWRKF